MGSVSEKITTFLPWTEIEPEAQKQILNTAELPFVFKWVAVMPDCHYGKGATVGTVIATKSAVVPAAVGVDIGCGMIALQTPLARSDLKELHRLREGIERRIPMSAGRNNSKIMDTAEPRIAELKKLEAATGGRYTDFDKEWPVALGTLGGGNHFAEVCLDENDKVWLTLHSGSRGVGNRIGNHYIRRAQEICRKRNIALPDRDLAYLLEGTEEFDNYLRDLKWAQHFALLNREEMMDRLLRELSHHVYGEAGHERDLELQRVNCHHNFAQVEHHSHGHAQLYRYGPGQRAVVPIRAAWRRPPHVPHQGARRLRHEGPRSRHGRHRVPQVQSSARRNSRRLQGHRPHHGACARTGAHRPHPAPNHQLQRRLKPKGPARWYARSIDSGTARR
jgi:RNA-splicing ligase RtcB